MGSYFIIYFLFDLSIWIEKRLDDSGLKVSDYAA